MGTDELREALRSVPVFARLADDILSRVAHEAVAVAVQAGDWIFRQGDEADRVFVVLSGRLEVVLESPPPARRLRSLSAGDPVGELGVLTGSTRAASVRAIRDSELLGVDRRTIDGMLEVPAFARTMIGALASHLQETAVGPVQDRRPTVIAVLVDDRQPWTGDFRAALFQGLGRDGPIAELTRPATPDASSFGRVLDDHERRHGRVLLWAGTALAGEWDQFCVRQADRVIVATTARAPRIALPGDTDLHVAVCGDRPATAGQLAPWMDAEPAATPHQVALGPAFAADVRRLGRRVSGSSLGVVMSGGGARGMAHIGVLDVLLEAGIDVDRIGGCSMGSLIGAMFAMGRSAGEVEEQCRQELATKKPFGDYTVPRASFLRGKRAQDMLVRMLGHGHIEEMGRSFFAVSCDLNDAHCVVHRRGPAWEAVGISASIPGLLPPVAREGRMLVDGGLLNNMPVDVMALESGPVVAIDVMAEGWRPKTVAWERRPTPGGVRGMVGHLAGRGPERVPALSETLVRTSVIGSWRLTQENRRRADLVVTPSVGHVGLLEFRRIDELVEAGRAAAREALPALESLLAADPPTA
ncbi:MAG: hypothetical protein V7605_2730 [Acidimicrobiaceae bacterium]